jgi:hypothetical protein
MEWKLMINIDAAFDVNTGRDATEVVMRDYIRQLQHKGFYLTW